MDDTSQRIIETVKCFMDASMSLVSEELINSDGSLTIVYSYAYGAIDALAERNGMNEVKTIGTAALFYHQYFEVSPDQAGEICGMQLAPAQMPYIQSGGQAILDWGSERDPNAPIRLLVLLNERNALQLKKAGNSVPPGQMRLDNDLSESQDAPVPAEKADDETWVIVVVFATAIILALLCMWLVRSIAS